MSSQEISILITSRNDLDKSSGGQASVASLTKSERVWLGAKVLGITYIVTLFFVLIPVLHFILVPAGLLIGIALFLSQYSLKENLLSGSATCPLCSKNFELKPGPSKWPKWEICPHCCNDLSIRIAPQ